MQQQKSIDTNRIANDLEAWKRIEDKLTERYGSKIIYDRDFLKAKRDIYKHIRNKYRSRPLNLFEKAEMRVLRGQHRNTMRQVYPNPIVRLMRNLLVFSGNLIAAGIKGLARLRKAAFSNERVIFKKEVARVNEKPAFKTYQRSGKVSSHLSNGQNSSSKEKVSQKNGKSNSSSKSIVRKLPAKARVQMSAVTGKGVKL